MIYNPRPSISKFKSQLKPWNMNSLINNDRHYDLVNLYRSNDPVNQIAAKLAIMAISLIAKCMVESKSQRK